jgi:hypothetical protein
VDLTPVRTIWIDETGVQADLRVRVGRLGDDIRSFAIHSLGWIRLCEMARFREIEFDPAATHAAAVRGLISRLRADGRDETPWITRAASYTGREWLVHQSVDLEDLIDWIERVHEFSLTPMIPSAIRVERLDDTAIYGDRDPIFLGVMEAWKGQSGGIDCSVTSPWVNQPWGRAAGVSVKVLVRDPAAASFVIMAYQPSLTTLWSTNQLDHFRYARITEQLPDRALASDVVRSAERALATRRPLAEMCHGPVRRSDGRVEFVDWKRVIAPAHTHDAAEPDAVVVYCRRQFAEQRHTG